MPYAITEQYLTSNFSNSVEAYKKGAGHLSRENIRKGLFFIGSRQLLPPFFLFAIFFTMVIDNTARKTLSKFINPVAILIPILTS